MENIPIENAEVDKQGKQVSQYSLGLPTILRQILRHLSTKDLLEFSLVNKLWNFEARSVMKERGNVTAKIIHGEFKDGCQPERLSRFASDLGNMTVIPFSGIGLHISHQFDVCPISNEPLLYSSYKVILDLIPWKHFSVQLHDCDHWVCWRNCPVFVLLKQILQYCSGCLEDLTLEYGKQQFLLPFFQDRTFPRLKCLTFGMTSPLFGAYPSKTTFVQALVSRAPNLQELRVCPIDLRMNVLKGSSAVLVPQHQLRPLSKPICEELIGRIRVEDLFIRIDRKVADPRLLNRLVPMLLNGSHRTLKTLWTDLFFTLPLTCYGICLENVTKLVLFANCCSLEKIEPSILAIVKGFDFTRVFPRLNQVLILDDDDDSDDDDLEFSAGLVRTFVEQANAVVSRGLPERAINIKLLNLVVWRSMDDSNLSLLAHMFPDVKTVRTLAQPKGPTFADLREHFLCLEEVIDSIKEYQN